METLNKSYKLNLSSVRETGALLAFSAPIPSLLTEPGAGIRGRDDSSFSKFPTFKKWEEKGKDMIVSTVEHVKTGLEKGVDDHIPSSSPAYAVMKLSISESTAIVSHVAGTRMIAQGTDGLSRGALNEGIMLFCRWPLKNNWAFWEVLYRCNSMW